MGLWRIGRTDDYIMHYGTKRHSGRYPWGSGERPYQGEERGNGLNDEASVINYLSDKGFKKIEYDSKYYHQMLKDVKVTDSLGRKTSISITIDADPSYRYNNSNELNTREFEKVVSDVEKNWQSIDKKIREQIVNSECSEYDRPWIYDDKPQMSLSEIRKDFSKRIGIAAWDNEIAHTYVRIDPFNGYIGEVGYEDGGAYYGHFISVDIDWKSKRAGNVSING